MLWKPGPREILPGWIEEEWYWESMEKSGSLHWTHSPDGNLIITHKIFSPNGSHLGLIYMLLDYDSIFGELLEQPFNGTGELYIIDNNNTILASSDLPQIGQEVSALNRNDQLEKVQHSENMINEW